MKKDLVSFWEILGYKGIKDPEEAGSMKHWMQITNSWTILDTSSADERRKP